MDIELKYSILRKIIWIVIILIIIGLIILFSILLAKVKQKNFEQYMQEIRNIELRITEISTNQENIVGVNIVGLDAEHEYSKAINGIKEKYGIDIKSEGYYFLNERNTENLNIGTVKRVYVVNYEKEIVLCLQPIKYKGVIYYTTQEIENKIFKNYSYSCPVIPEGFRHKYGNWDTGYVIIDSHGNEFVWVPVGILNEERPSDAFKRYYRTSQYGQYKTKEYLDIKASIDKYGGFYIAKYEASLQGATNTESKGKNNIIQSIPNVIPLTQVTYKNEPENKKIGLFYGYDENGNLSAGAEGRSIRCAYELCTSMSSDYDWVKNGIHTTIEYSEHFDTFFYVANKLGIIPKMTENALENPTTENSNVLGNYIDSEFRYKKTKDSDLIIKLKDEGIILPTGSYLYKLNSDEADSRNCIMNVYDMAGNVAEWTIEEVEDVSAVIRGGNYTATGKDDPVAKYEIVNKTFATSTTGVRPVMYID